MNNNVSKSIQILIHILKQMKFNDLTTSDFKEITKNNPNYLLKALKLIFNSLQYLKHNETDSQVVNELFSNFPIDSICTFLSEELINLGYFCVESDLKQPNKCFHGFCYIWNYFLIGKILQQILHFSNSISVPINHNNKTQAATTKTAFLPLPDDSIQNCTILKQRINNLIKQISTLSEMIRKKDQRIKNAPNFNLSIEMIYLLKNPSILSQFSSDIKSKNEFIHLICEWFENESQFWNWVASLKFIDNSPIDNEQIIDLLSRRKIEIDKLHDKLVESEQLANQIDELWNHFAKDNDNINCVEVVSKLNAESFAESCGNNLIDYLPIQSDSNDCLESFESINGKFVEINLKFKEKCQNKLKKLSKYANGLILDGSK